MFEGQTFEVIMNRMLARVSDEVDKREGSIIWDALAPAAAELAQAYINLDVIVTETFADTANGKFLTLRAAERGINRRAAIKANRLGFFTDNNGSAFNPPIGSRFTGDALIFKVLNKITEGEFRLECETAGEKGNGYTGTLTPVEHIPGLAGAILSDILIPGEEEENDENLRARYFANLKGQAYGGNIADYKEKVKELSGVGGVKVYPVWDGGGTVKLVIIDNTYKKPSTTLLDDVQETIDPEGNQGEGLGIAPIGHVVTVDGVDEETINLETLITYQDGYAWDDVKTGVEAVINEYFEELRYTWEASDNLVVRTSQIESRVLNVVGVLDIQNTVINNAPGNFVLDANHIPVLGMVTPS